MNHFEVRDGQLFCEDVALEHIAAAVGAPFYVYSSATLARHYDIFCAAFAPREPLVAFAVKASGNIAVIATLARRGAGADTVSAGEIKRALAAGVAPARIIFSGVGKTDEEIAFALDTGIHQINVESAHELARVDALAAARDQRADVVLRVNPNVAGGGHDKISTGRTGDKFGVSAADALRLYTQGATSPNLTMRGLATHVGSQIVDLAPMRAAFTLLRDMTESLRAAGQVVERLDLGGGLAAPYGDDAAPPLPADYAAMVNEVMAGLDVALAFEPGRMIAANAGVLAARALRVQERDSGPILVLDAGFNDLVRPAMYEAYHDIRPVREPSPAAPRRAYDVVGPICESGDSFARKRALPDIAPGALVAIMSAGAYGASMSSTYNARPLIPEVLVRGARFEVVRRRWSVEEQIALEAIPAWLDA